MTKNFNAKEFLKNVTDQPGAYRMYDLTGTVIYVGKAKNLKNRLSSYFLLQEKNSKTAALLKKIAHIDVTITNTETEALLLEHNYIKRYQPRYNVLLRDDKSYSFILLSDDKHPRLSIHRGGKKQKGEYFGPFPHAQAVRETLSLLQKIFPVRQCENSVYRNRSRPCLQYQIHRCSGPCVTGLVTESEYKKQVNYSRLFLSGKNQQVLTQLVAEMETASKALHFEKAAQRRDQIQAMHKIIEKQSISGKKSDIDAISIANKLGATCVQVLFIRQGKVLGSRSYFPTVPSGTELSEIAQTFIGQFYLHADTARTLPKKILIDFYLPEEALLTASLAQFAGRKIQIQSRPRTYGADYLRLAHTNATNALMMSLSQKATIDQRMQALADTLHLETINRIECFDISHLMGEQTVASCVVFDANGPIRSAYRRYNIIGVTPGDDYAALFQVLKRRYSKIEDAEKMPDIIFIDGGKGQLSQAVKVFSALTISWHNKKPLLIGVAKGSDRKIGLETLFFEKNGSGHVLSPDSPALHLIQHIRNEAHQHAITGHRQQRKKIKNSSVLEKIPGIGPKRRQMLLKHMGGLRPLRNASIETLAKVPTISLVLAKKINLALK